MKKFVITNQVTGNKYQGDSSQFSSDAELISWKDAHVASGAFGNAEDLLIVEEDATDYFAKMDRIKIFESKSRLNTEKEICENVLRYIGQLNKEKSFSHAQKDTIMGDQQLQVILNMILAGRPSKAKLLIQSYSSTTYYTEEEKQTIVDYINDRLS
jgi:hypothetical protein